MLTLRQQYIRCLSYAYCSNTMYKNSRIILTLLGLTLLHWRYVNRTWRYVLLHIGIVSIWFRCVDNVTQVYLFSSAHTSWLCCKQLLYLMLLVIRHRRIQLALTRHTDHTGSLYTVYNGHCCIVDEWYEVSW